MADLDPNYARLVGQTSGMGTAAQHQDPKKQQGNAEQQMNRFQQMSDAMGKKDGTTGFKSVGGPDAYSSDPQTAGNIGGDDAMYAGATDATLPAAGGAASAAGAAGAAEGAEGMSSLLEGLGTVVAI